MYPKIGKVVTIMFAAAALPLCGQVAVEVQKAELSVPFGVASGRLITVAEYLVFSDDEKPEASFAVERRQIRDLSTAEDTLTLETNNLVRDRTGERSKFTFRFTTPAAGQNSPLGSRRDRAKVPVPLERRPTSSLWRAIRSSTTTCWEVVGAA